MAAIRLSNAGSPSAGPALFASRAQEQEAAAAPGAGATRRVIACVNDASMGTTVLNHAAAIGGALGLPVTVARSIETPRHLDAPVDPIEWQVRRRQGQRDLERVASLAGNSEAETDCVLLAGPAADELSDWAAANGGAIMALATREHSGRPPAGLGSTAHGVLQRGVASLLLVPPASSGAATAAYRRILVPLDGSPRAESVLPIAVRIARAHSAELILAHAVPHPEILGEGIFEEPTHDLRHRLEEQNERRARAYLDELRMRLWNEKLAARSIIARNGDPREQLRRLVADQHADLVILASHGRSGLGDVACGSVAEYLAMHASAPLLIVRPSLVRTLGRTGGARAPQITTATPETVR